MLVNAMRKELVFLSFIIGMTLSPPQVQAQGFGICDRQANEIGMSIANDAARRIYQVSVLNLPPDEKQALILLHMRARDRAFGSVEQQRTVCYTGYRSKQEMASIVVQVYTGGLSEFLPPSMTYVDMSEIMNGTPLGGPNAVIPRARDDAMSSLGISGDVGKIIRDPQQILPWNW